MADSTVERVVRGRVVKPAAEREPQGVAGAWVVLHRVGADRAAPLDSVRSGARGAYAFRYRATGRADALYFVSAEHGGIAYFTSPLRARLVEGDDALITVFDTTSAAVPLDTRGRHIVVASPAADGSREVIEVYELSNDTTVARISPDDDHPTWTVGVPAAARHFRAEQGEVPAAAMSLKDGTVRVVAPIAPGIKQVGFRYVLPASAFPLSIPLPEGSDVLEVLVEDSTTTVQGARLAAQDPVSVEGRPFRRWMASDAPRNAVVTITTRDAPAGSRLPFILAGVALAVGVATLIALSRAFRRYEARAEPRVTIARGDPQEGAEQLARAIADLDARFEAAAAPTERQRAQYEAHRAELKRRLADALAAARDAG